MANLTKIIIAVGSNHNPLPHIAQAKALLKENFDDIAFTQSAWTESLGMKAAPFVNCIAYGHTQMSCDETKRRLKAIERQCGDGLELRGQRKIVMDLDILLYGDSRLHVEDWSRPYIKNLMLCVDTSKL